MLMSAAALLFAACNKDNTTTPGGSGNGTSSNVSFALKAANPSATVTQKTTTGAAIRWTSGFAYPSMVKFEAKQITSAGVENEVEYKATNTARIDLFAPVAPLFGNFTLPAGTYNEVELKLQLGAADTTPALQLSGNFTNSTGTTTPVTFRINEPLELKTETHNVTIDSARAFDAITVMDLAGLTSDIREAQLQNAQLTNGALVISSSSNSNLYGAILNSLRNRRHHSEINHH